MATLIIRDVPDDDIALLDAQAQAAGQSREAWLRTAISALAHDVRPRTNYAIHFSRQGEAGFGGMIVQHDGSTQGSHLVGNHGRIPQDSFEAYFAALHLVEQNAPGDREAAIALLERISDAVYEVPYRQPRSSSKESNRESEA